jgi:hypothetical protein
MGNPRLKAAGRGDDIVSARSFRGSSVGRAGAC